MSPSATDVTAGALSLAACAAWGLEAPAFLNLVGNGTLTVLALLLGIALVLSLLVGGLRALRQRGGKVAFSLALVFTALTAFAVHFIFLTALVPSLVAAINGLAHAFKAPANPATGSTG